MQTMQVACPDGCGPGSMVMVMSPAGQQVQVQVPQGVGPGMMFQVQLPAAPSAVPVAMAQPVMMAPMQQQFASCSPWDVLASLPRVEVREKADMIQAVTALIGVEVDMANKYQVIDPNGQQVFYVVETTDFCTRNLKRGGCADCVGWNADVLFTAGGQQSQFLHMSRDHSCTFLCFNRPIVDIIDVTTQRTIGKIQDPFACCDLTFHLMDENEQPVLQAKGGCCQWGLCCPLPCGPCASVAFDIVDATTGDKVGEIEKKVPSCLKFLMPGADIDNYHVDFNGVTHPEWKAVVMLLSVFIDFRYFSETQDPQDVGDTGLIGMMNDS